MIGSVSSPSAYPGLQGPPVARATSAAPPADAGAPGAPRAEGDVQPGTAAPRDGTGKSASTGGPAAQLSADEQRELRALEARDAEVRAHEAAHMSAGGDLVRGAASFSYQRGPDGRQYAVGGEVSIDISAGRTPEETIAKAERIRAAALAPAQPSAQDMQVAAQAARLAAEARTQLAATTRGAYQDSLAGKAGGIIDAYA